jgi:hypothetical protein
MLSVSLLSLVLSAGASSRLAQDVAQLRTQVLAGNWVRAAELARSVEARVAQRAPLEVTDGQVIIGPPAGLGMYEPVPGGIVKQDELFLYAQVRNHVLRQSTRGFELHLVSDLIVIDAKGEELARDQAFAESRYTARVPHRDTFVVIALRSRGLPSGHYRMRVVVTDRIGGSSGQVDIPLQIP